MRAPLLGMACLLVIASPALAKAKATPDEQRAATLSYLDCMRGRVATLDDGTSDAETVGRAVALSCRGPMSAMVDTYAKGFNRNVRDTLYRRKVAEEGPTGAAVVLKYRHDQREAAAH